MRKISRTIKYLKILALGNFYIYLFLCVLIFVGLIIALLLNTTNIIEHPFWGGVIVEATGFLLDIFLFGVIISLYSKHQEIKGYQNEIVFFRGWRNEEGMRRTVGNVRLLSDEGVENIDLFFCYLEGAVLSELNLKGANMSNADLQNSYLIATNLERADLRSSNLQNANLKRANLNGAKLNGANLEGVLVIDSNWIENLEKWGVRGYEEIKNKYKLVSTGEQDSWTRKPTYRIELR